jgi:hypothetical protein
MRAIPLKASMRQGRQSCGTEHNTNRKSGSTLHERTTRGVGQTSPCGLEHFDREHKGLRAFETERQGNFLAPPESASAERQMMSL